MSEDYFKDVTEKISALLNMTVVELSFNFATLYGKSIGKKYDEICILAMLINQVSSKWNIATIYNDIYSLNREKRLKETYQ